MPLREIAASSSLFAFEKIWDNGYRQITSSTKPIKTPEDLNGFKIRVPPSPLWTSMFSALGAAPAAKGLTGRAAGVEPGGPVAFSGLGIEEQAMHLSVGDHDLGRKAVADNCAGK